MLELYTYYRTAPADAADVQRAWRSLRDELVAALPGLQARLLVRADRPSTDSPHPPAEPSPTVTWMEIYHRPPHGLDDESIALIESRARVTLGAWIHGARHREVFRTS